MAYDRAKLQRIGPQNRNAPSFFTFSDTSSALTAIDAAGYFNDASDILKVGDLIYANASSNTYGFFVVNANSGGTVDVTNALAVGSVDSD